MRRILVLLSIGLTVCGCAIHVKGEADATMLKPSSRDAARAGANNVLLAKMLLEGGVSPAEVRRQLELGGATSEEAERIATAAQVLCRCGKQ